MSRMEWVKNEIALACEKIVDKADTVNYETALQAYDILLKAVSKKGSFFDSAEILDKLVSNIPLTPIENTPDIWKTEGVSMDGKTMFQCKRCLSLFKIVDDRGGVSYSDTERFVCKNIKTNEELRFPFVEKAFSKELPITFPYFKKKPMTVYCEPVGNKNGYVDMVHIVYIQTEKGQVGVDRFFTSKKDKDRMQYTKQDILGEWCNGFWKELTKSDYARLKKYQRVQ